MQREKKSQPKKGISLDERAFFRQAIGEQDAILEPENSLSTDKHETSNKIGIDSKPAGNRNLAQGIIRDGGDLFYRPGVQRNTLRALKRGRFRVRAEIDLHGCNKKEALSYLKSFITQCNLQQTGCVRIVTGKGKGSPNKRSVIREATLIMLSNEPRVLAYSAALPNDGGSGALYVLLTS